MLISCSLELHLLVISLGKGVLLHTYYYQILHPSYHLASIPDVTYLLMIYHRTETINVGTI